MYLPQNDVSEEDGVKVQGRGGDLIRQLADEGQ